MRDNVFQKRKLKFRLGRVESRVSEIEKSLRRLEGKDSQVLDAERESDEVLYPPSGRLSL
jgi:hypothetical protein